MASTLSQNDFQTLQVTVERMKSWISRMPECAIFGAAYQDSQILYESVFGWVQSIPPDWEDNPGPGNDKKNKEGIDKSSNNSGMRAFESSDLRLLNDDELALKDLTTSLKLWLERMPNCLREALAYADEKTSGDPVKSWLKIMPSDWRGECQSMEMDDFLEVKSEENISATDDDINLPGPPSQEPMENICLTPVCEQDVKEEMDEEDEEDGNSEELRQWAAFNQQLEMFKDQELKVEEQDDISEDPPVLKFTPGQEADSYFEENSEDFAAEVDFPSQIKQKAHRKVKKSIKKPKKEPRVKPSTTFHCPVCDFQTTRLGDFNKHKLTHGFKKDHFPCSFCDVVTSRSSTLRIHVDAAHRGVKHPCDQCDKVFRHNAGLRKHIRAFHLKISYNCEQCDFTTYRVEALRIHEDAVHKGIRHYCDQCTYETTTSYGLTAHIKYMHGGQKKKKKKKNKKFQCDSCVFSCTENFYLKQHIATEHEGKLFECEHCDFASKHPISLKAHVDSKHKNIRLKCPDCDLSFGYVGNLRRHKREAAKLPPGSRFTCHICHIVSCMPLKRHMNEHDDQAKLHRCNVCNRGFSSQSYLKTHKRKAHGIVPASDTATDGGEEEGDEEGERGGGGGANSTGAGGNGMVFDTMGTVCDECGYIFGSNEDLKEHIKAFHMPPC